MTYSEQQRRNSPLMALHLEEEMSFGLAALYSKLLIKSVVGSADAEEPGHIEQPLQKGASH